MQIYLIPCLEYRKLLVNASFTEVYFDYIMWHSQQIILTFLCLFIYLILFFLTNYTKGVHCWNKYSTWNKCQSSVYMHWINHSVIFPSFLPFLFFYSPPSFFGCLFPSLGLPYLFTSSPSSSLIFLVCFSFLNFLSFLKKKVCLMMMVMI